MSWFNVWDSLKTKTCRYLLQRYLGKFFESKLNLEQLKVDLYNGKAVVQNVSLNVEALNDLFESQGWGFEVISGHIGDLTVVVPWNALMTNDSSVEVSNLIIILRPVRRQPTGASMLESMWSSVSSSIQMAEECMNQSDDDLPYEMHGNTIAGLEKFAETIDNVLNRIHAKFSNVILKIEHTLPNHVKQLSLFLKISTIEYQNETGCEKYCGGHSPTVSKSKSKTENGCDAKENTNLMPSIAKHNILVKGFVIYTAECCVSDKDLYDTKFSWNGMLEKIENIKMIPIIELKGCQKVIIKAKQTENTEGPKICLDIEIGSIYAFMTPRQIHHLLKLLHICYSESSDHASLRETSKQLHKSNKADYESTTSSILNFSGNWSRNPDDFHATLSKDNVVHKSILNETNNMDDSISTFVSTISTCSRQKQNVFETSGEILRFNVQVTSINAIALHNDVLKSDEDPFTYENISESSFSNLQKLAHDFFSSVEEECAYETEEFNYLCEKDCLYLKVYPLFVNGNQQRNQKMLLSTINVTATKLDFFEILEKRSRYLVMFDRSLNCAQGYHTQPEISLSVKSSFSCALNNSVCNSIDIELAKCTFDIDISIYDRLSALLGVSPFSEIYSHRTRKDFNEVQNSSLEITITCTLLQINLRFPIVDAKTLKNPEKVQWWKQNIRDDLLIVKLSNAILKTNSLLSTITMNEITGFYSIDNSDNPKQLFKGILFNDNQPRITIQQRTKSSELSTRKNSSSLRFGSPFSAKHVWRQSDAAHSSHSKTDAENSFLPGETEEINNFCKCAMDTTQLQISVQIPFVEIIFESKQLYEVVYNRLNSDLLMWKPSSPLYRKEAKSENKHKSYVKPTEHLFFENVQKGSILDSYLESKSGTINIDYSKMEKNTSESSIYLSTNEEFPSSSTLKHNNESRANSTSAVEVCIDEAAIVFFVPVRNVDSQILTDQVGKFYFLAKCFKLFAVNGFNQNDNLNYVCLQLNEIEVYHCGNFPYTNRPFANNMKDVEDCMEITFYSIPKRSKSYKLVEKRKEVISLVIEIKKETRQRIKRLKVSTGINKAVLAHNPGLPPNTWLYQLIDFFDIADYPIEGYHPYALITELQIHLWDCAIDYRPHNFPYHSFVNIGYFTISSNVISSVTGCNLRFIAEECTLSIAPSNNLNVKKLTLKVDDLKQEDLVTVIQLGLFDISLRLNGKTIGLCPKMDLRCSIQDVHVRTCYDSARALAQLIAHLASDNSVKSNPSDSNSCSDDTLVSAEVNSKEINSKQQQVNQMVAEALQDEYNTATNTRADKTQACVKKPEIFYFPDESKRVTLKNISTESIKIETIEVENDMFVPLVQTDLGSIDKGKTTDNHEEQDFCFIKEDDMLFSQSCGLDRIKTSEEPLRIVDNHFSLPQEKQDFLRSPDKFPVPDCRYTLCEMTFVWHLYGGNDFTASVNDKLNLSKSNISLMSETYKNGVSQPTGNTQPNQTKTNIHTATGNDRNLDKLVEIQITKLSFCHEIYPESAIHASRQVLLISEIEVRDRLRTSEINKFLYHPNVKNLSTKNNQHMVIIKTLHVRPNPEQSTAEECSLRISILPIKLNIDQETLLFLEEYFVNLTNSSSSEPLQNEKTEVLDQQIRPVLAVDEVLITQQKITENLDLLIDEDNKEENKNKINEPTDHPVYFREVIFSPALPICLDYHGRRIELSRGPVAGLLMGLAQLQGSGICLRELEYRRGILGWNKLFQYLGREWLKDIRRNQLPKILSGLGPTNAVLQLFQGVYDLFWLPIEQYQKDGRIIRGFQLGAQSFSARTALAALELTSRVINLLQFTAETTFDMLSAGPSIRKGKKYKYGKKRHNRPKDLREGVTNAYIIVKEGINNSANNLIETAVIEHDQKGYTGAVGAVMRQIPQLMVCPAVLATQATTNILGGAKSSLIPEAKLEAREKWKEEPN